MNSQRHRRMITLENIVNSNCQEKKVKNNNLTDFLTNYIFSCNEKMTRKMKFQYLNNTVACEVDAFDLFDNEKTASFCLVMIKIALSELFDENGNILPWIKNLLTKNGYDASLRLTKITLLDQYLFQFVSSVALLECKQVDNYLQNPEKPKIERGLVEGYFRNRRIYIRALLKRCIGVSDNQQQTRYDARVELSLMEIKQLTPQKMLKLLMSIVSPLEKEAEAKLKAIKDQLANVTKDQQTFGIFGGKRKSFTDQKGKLVTVRLSSTHARIINVIANKGIPNVLKLAIVENLLRKQSNNSKDRRPSKVELINALLTIAYGLQPESNQKCEHSISLKS